MNYHTPKLLAGRGFTYDSSLMDSDHPYVLATDEEPGVATLVEVPVSSGLDDGERYAFLPSLITVGDLAAHVGSLGQAPRTCPRPYIRLMQVQTPIGSAPRASPS